MFIVGVHQKLSILFVNKNLSSNSKLYTSDYNYWYKNERDNLFNKPSVVLNKFKLDECYLKIGSKIEEDVFKKISKFGDNLLNLENKSGNNKLFLNMRATYWIKSFIEKPNKLNEYKVLRFSENNLHLANCILNSSLYWWFWIKISDCWHITNKELKYFSVPQINSEQIQRIKSLSLKLNSALEKSKKRIDTKQTMYEYKHKSCKKLIDKIDDELAKLYSLSEKEVSFIKKYKENYRIGRLDK